MSRELVLAIDQGTTGTTALLVDRDLNIVHKVTTDFEQVFPKPGWVEHRADDIWRSLEASVTRCLAQSGHTSNDIACIGITNQRETTGLFDRSGRLIHNFIVWQCRRTTEICQRMKSHGHEPMVRERTGLVLDPYFSATKLAWIFDTLPGTRELAQKGELLFGTIDTWLLRKMTDGGAHLTDATNASRTLMMNLSTGQWDDELLHLFNVPRTCLPEIRSSSEIYGYTKGLSFLRDNIPIAGIAGDQQAALFGQACFEAGQAKVTFGTGAFILLHTGEKKVISEHGLLTSVALRLKDKQFFCLEGSAFVAGAAVQWLRDGLKMITSSAEIEVLASQVEDSGEVNFVPALSGLGAPYWRPEARGLLSGVSRGTTRAHIARAVLEGIALQNHDIIDAMKKDGVDLNLLKVDGGASANNLLMQMQADFLNVKCVRPSVIASTGLGAAALAGLGVGLFAGVNELSSAWKADRVFDPSMGEGAREGRIAKWRLAVSEA